jgi:hypothetical protein
MTTLDDDWVEEGKQTMKTSELTGVALDWAVAKCENFDTRNNYRCQVIDADDIEYVFECYADDDAHAEEQALDMYPNSEVYLIEHLGIYSPSTDWSQGGPIIERERIHVQPSIGGVWQAELVFGKQSYGPTPLVAAIRCYVASKLGDDVEIPEELK